MNPHTYINAGGGSFDIAQTITEFHSRLEHAQTNGSFLEQDWLHQQSIVQGLFWTHIREPGPGRSNCTCDWIYHWCFGYNGYVFRYPESTPWQKHYDHWGSVDWDTLFQLQPCAAMISYITHRCASAMPQRPETTEAQTSFATAKTQVNIEGGAVSSTAAQTQIDSSTARRLYAPLNPIEKRSLTRVWIASSRFDTRDYGPPLDLDIEQ